MNYYNLLEVASTATQDEIKKAYRKKASIWHPDKEGGDTEKFKTLQIAYDTLSDVQKRQQYDMQLSGASRSGPQFNWDAQPDINDIIQKFGFNFSHGFGQFDQQQFHRHQQPQRNKDLRIAIPVLLESTLTEQVKTIQIKTTNGSDTTVEVRIPRGVTSETIIKYSGLGDNLIANLPRGDLYVHFNIQNSGNFQVIGLDLYTQVPVNSLLAIVGGKITVSSLDNKKFELAIPKSTPGGMKFRIAQQGLYQLNSDGRGDLYVEIVLTIPDNLSEEQLHSIRSILDSQLPQQS